jgi:hypothetical protein
MHVTKRLDLRLLQSELTAAAVVVNGLGHTGTDTDGEVFTYDGLLAVELPAGGAAVVDAHTAPPPVVEYAGAVPAEAVVRTTDGAPKEIFRFTTHPKHVYRAMLNMTAIDAGSGTTKDSAVHMTFKATATAIVQVGATGTLYNVQDAGTGGAGTWVIASSFQFPDLVITVTGAAGRTIDWLLAGSVAGYSPEGLA